jgi:hypothetical protein
MEFAHHWPVRRSWISTPTSRTGTDWIAREPVVTMGANDPHGRSPAWTVEPSAEIGLAIVPQSECDLLARAGRLLPGCLDVPTRIAAGKAPGHKQVAAGALDGEPAQDRDHPPPHLVIGSWVLGDRIGVGQVRCVGSDAFTMSIREPSGTLHLKVSGVAAHGKNVVIFGANPRRRRWDAAPRAHRPSGRTGCTPTSASTSRPTPTGPRRHRHRPRPHPRPHPDHHRNHPAGHRSRPALDRRRAVQGVLGRLSAPEP